MSAASAPDSSAWRCMNGLFSVVRPRAGYDGQLPGNRNTTIDELAVFLIGQGWGSPVVPMGQHRLFLDLFAIDRFLKRLYIWISLAS